MAKKTVHTVPNGNQWSNKVDGKVTSNHRTKENAVKEGRSQAKDLKTEHKIHNKDGKISDSNSYGKDPYPPKDKK